MQDVDQTDQTVQTDQTDLIADICIDTTTLALKDYGTRRVGRPRYNWWEHGLQHYWDYLTKEPLHQYNGHAFSQTNRAHAELLKQAAHDGVGHACWC